MRTIMLMLFGIYLAFLGCYPESGVDSSEQLDIIVTLYDPSVDFSGYKTYFLQNEIAHFADSAAVDTITREYDDLILQRIDDNMIKAGYVKKSKPLTSVPDLAMFVMVLYAKHSGSIWQPGWWYQWDWSGWLHYPWSEEAVPSMRGYEAPYSYSTGTLLISMIDTKKSSLEEQRLTVVWHASMNGVLAETSENAAARLEAGINQCFQQSVYLFAGE